MKGKFFTLAAALAFTVTGAVAKDNQPQKLAEPNFYGTTLDFSSRAPASASTITISGPNDFSAHTSSKRGMASVQLANFGHVPDGVYMYRLEIRSGASVKLKDNGNNNGRDPDKAHYGVKSQIQTGHFYVKHGNIQNLKEMSEAEHH